MKLRQGNWKRSIIYGIAGPIAALAVTWQPVLDITMNWPARSPSVEIVEGSRVEPTDSVLRELRSVAVSYPGFLSQSREQVLAAADDILNGRVEIYGLGSYATVPFQVSKALYGTSTAHLDLSSFVLPSLLGRAFEVSNDTKYLKHAVRYILDWEDHENSLFVPRGLFYNDHAIASRAIVLTEIWRLYRESSMFETSEAVELLRYANRLGNLLRTEELYEYRTNHGIMQNLALLHLAIGFPLLEDSESNLRVGVERQTSQLEYYLNSEGVILEHSASYQHNGLSRLAAHARYLGLLDMPFSREMVDRYKNALAFNALLLRPDSTLPVIGDSVDQPHTTYSIAEFDSESIVSTPLRAATPLEIRPDRQTYIAAGGGYAVVWSGLENWPRSDDLAQAIIHWANFPTKVHKHADELAISIWAGGVQWIRSIGSWPYVDSRTQAIGWRSSNAPHWQDESPEEDRSSELLQFVVDDDFALLDTLRRNADGRTIRRQFLKIEDDMWAVLDSFTSDEPANAETVWRFSPSLELQPISSNQFVLLEPGSTQAIGMQIQSAGGFAIDADTQGALDWNSGLVFDGEIVPSPAIRVTTGSNHSPIATLIDWRGRAASNTSITLGLQWDSETQWSITIGHETNGQLEVRRIDDQVQILKLGTNPVSKDLAKPARSDGSMSRPLDAYYSALDRYGSPFAAQLARRGKVTLAIAIAGLMHLLSFAFVANASPVLWRTHFALSTLGWCTVCLFLGFRFLT
jgi:hypothetical protein